MKRVTVWNIAVIIVFGIALAIILKYPRQIAKHFPTVSPMPTDAVTANAKQVTGLPYVVTMQKINEGDETYKVTGTFPQMVGDNTEAITAFNDGINAVVKEAVTSFKKDVEEMGTIEPQPSPSLPPSEMRVSFKTDEIPGKFVSILFDLSPYISGAAHPNQLYISSVFDVEQKKFLQLSDVFKPKTGYLSTLSTNCISSLTTQMKAKMYVTDTATIKSGCAPEAENFQTFTLAPGVLVLHFSAYSVGPWVAGPAHVAIPSTKLKSSLAISIDK